MSRVNLTRIRCFQVKIYGVLRNVVISAWQLMAKVCTNYIRSNFAMFSSNKTNTLVVTIF